MILFMQTYYSCLLTVMVGIITGSSTESYAFCTILKSVLSGLTNNSKTTEELQLSIKELTRLAPWKQNIKK